MGRLSLGGEARKPALLFYLNAPEGWSKKVVYEINTFYIW